MKFCTNCGSQLPDESVFCTHCGATLADESGTPSTGSGYEGASAQNSFGAFGGNSTEPTTGAFGYSQQPQQPQQPAFQQPQPQSMPQGIPTPPPQQGGYQTPQQGYQMPQQGYQGPQPGFQQAPVEQSANIGLAILSFFIPLVGLIMFLTQKDKKPKTAKACGIAALISFVLGIIISVAGSILAAKTATDNFNDIDSIVDDIDWGDVSDTDTDTTDSDVIFGSFDDYTYRNEYFYVYYSLPSDFRFQTYEEISSDDLDYDFDEETGVPYAENSTARIYYDSTAVNEDIGTTIITGCVAKGSDFSTADEVLDYFVDTDDEDITNVTSYSDKYIAGLEFRTSEVTYDVDGTGMYAGYYVTEKDGSYFLIYIFSTDTDDNRPSDYVEDYFF